MAIEELPDFDELAAELTHLEHRQAELERRLVSVRERHGAFPNDVSARQLRELQTELVDRRRRINDLKVQLLPVMRRSE